MPQNFRSRIQLLFMLTPVMLAGCTVGPRYHSPAVKTPQTYNAKPLPEKTSSAPVPEGEAQYFILSRDIPAQWWSLFRNENLDRLIRKAMAGSPTLDSARSALTQAQENLRAQFGQVAFPDVNAGFSAKREKSSGSSFGQPGFKSNIFNLFNASVSVSYFFDFFGKGRRQLEALSSQVEYQSFQWEAAYLALSANVVTAAGKEAALRAQIRATEDIIAEEEGQLKIVEKQFGMGGVSRSDVLAQKEQLAQTRAELPPLRKQLKQIRNYLSVLVGEFPDQAAELPEFEIQTLHLPRELPVTLPSRLLRQRPDIRAAESLLHAASARVGVATANLFPQITISGAYGSEAAKTGQLFSGGTSVWELGAQLVQPVFYRGQLTARRRAAVAAYNQAAAVYRGTVLSAFRDVADVLSALEEDANALKAQTEAESAAKENFQMTKTQFRDGAVSYLSLLNAQRRYQQARISLIQVQALRLADTAALFQALGGGWWNRATAPGEKEISDTQ